MTNEAPMFEIPDTLKARAYVGRNPKFPDALIKLLDHKCFGRQLNPKNQIENICFGLGHTSRQDFLEVAFFAINGYGDGATKILRCLYERAVTIEYLIQNPEKIDRFLQFATIQENRAVEATLKQVPEEQIDATLGPENTVAEVRKRYQQYKGSFKATACPACGVKPHPRGTLTSSRWSSVWEEFTARFSFSHTPTPTSEFTPHSLRQSARRRTRAKGCRHGADRRHRTFPRGDESTEHPLLVEAGRGYRCLHKRPAGRPSASPFTHIENVNLTDLEPQCSP